MAGRGAVAERARRWAAGGSLNVRKHVIFYSLASQAGRQRVVEGGSFVWRSLGKEKATAAAINQKSSLTGWLITFT